MELHDFSQLEHNTLRVLYVKEPPFVNNVDLENDYHEGHYDGPGIVMDILKIVGQRHDLKYKFTPSPSGAKYGSRLPNGSWDGMIGRLYRNEVDIIAAAMIVNEERKDAMDFTAAFMRTASGMLIRSPDQFIDNQFLIVTAPLQWQVWAMIALSIVISGFIFKGVVLGLRKLGMETTFSLLDCIWIFYAIFVQQDLSRLPACAATRTMLSFWWLAALSISGFFTGNMVALFAVTKSVLPFNTRDDMVRKVKESNYKIVLKDDSDVRMNFIKDSGLQVFQDLWGEMTKGKWINVSTLEEGVNRVISEPKLVFVGDKEALESIASSTCSVTTLDGDLIPVWYAIGMRKGSKYLEMFNDVINKLAENGFVDKWLRDAQMMQAYHRGTECNTSLGAGIGTGGNIDISGKPIQLEKAQGVFWLLVAGIVMGITFLVLERLLRLIKPPHHHAHPSHNLPVIQNQKSQVQIISINPINTSQATVPLPNSEPVESIDSYRPKVKTDAFVRTVTQGPGNPELRRQPSQGMYGAYGASFEPNVYGNNYGSVTIGDLENEISPHTISEDPGLKHRNSIVRK